MARKREPLVVAALGLVFILLALTRCSAKGEEDVPGSAPADLRAVEVRHSPVGVYCYAILQGTQAVGGGCFPNR